MVKRGVYRHYKGALYIVVGLAYHHDTRQLGVVYHGIELRGEELPNWNWRPLYGLGGWLTLLDDDDLPHRAKRIPCSSCIHPDTFACACRCHAPISEYERVRFTLLREIAS